MAIAALCIGGMVVARSLKDSRFSDRLRDAATHAALVLGGWERDATTLPNTCPSANSPAVLKRRRKDLTRYYHSSKTLIRLRGKPPLACITRDRDMLKTARSSPTA